MNKAQPRQIIKSVSSTDGAGVRINRVAGPALHVELDPYLMIDEIRSSDQQDYMAGFPLHPHRGFETITYLLQGRMKHEDHLGNQRVMSDGGVQWMTTGRGILHSEMPEPSVGLFHGFQIWLNLPREAKMNPPVYYDIDPDEVLVFQRSFGELKLLTGEIMMGDEVFTGAFTNGMRTQASIAELDLAPGAEMTMTVPEGHRLLVYVYQGDDQYVPHGHLGTYAEGQAMLKSDDGLRALLLMGCPLDEPVVQHGPFVMNSAAEIEAAFADFADGSMLS